MSIKSNIPLFISIVLIAAGLIIIRSQTTQTSITPGRVQLQGVVEDQPKQKGQSIYFKFQGYQIRTKTYPNISYGDRIQVDGSATEQGFIDFPNVKKIGEKDNFKTKLFTLRSKIEAKINKFLPEPQASLLSGVLLGVERGLPDDFEESLLKTGTIHVVVVSGYNIGVVGGFFLLLAGVIRRKYAIILAILAIVFYTLLTGAQPPTIRAAVMGGLAFSATLLGRQNLPLYTLLLAGFLMIMINPEILSNVGFQLSFLATAGIILFKDPVFSYLKRLPSPLSEDLTTTLSAQILVIPIIFFHFGQVSIISPLVNALVLWTIPLSTIIGFPIALFGLIFEPLGQLLAWVVWAPLSIFIWIVEAANKIPVSLLEIPEKNIFLVIAYYLALISVIFLIIKYVRIYKNKSV